MALPNNHIPRIFANTGIEYQYTADFVKTFAKDDERIIILKQQRNIKQTLNEYGYPFKSKVHNTQSKIIWRMYDKEKIRKEISMQNR